MITVVVTSGNARGAVSKPCPPGRKVRIIDHAVAICIRGQTRPSSTMRIAPHFIVPGVNNAVPVEVS